MKFRETMEERGYGEEEIEAKVAEVRKKLVNQVWEIARWLFF